MKRTASVNIPRSELPFLGGRVLDRESVTGMLPDIIAHQDMSEEQLALVASLLSGAPPVSIRVHLGVPFEAPSARGVTFRKPGRKPSDTELAAVYDEAPKQGQHFIMATRNDVVDDVSLVLTVAHELEHVRQEQGCPGILDLGNLARDFVEAKHALFPTLPCELFLPVNLHAEAWARHAATAVLDGPSVTAHYDETPDLRTALDRTDPDAAATDLASFFQDNWENFEGWYKEADRPTKPSLQTVQQFVEQPCDEL